MLGEWIGRGEQPHACLTPAAPTCPLVPRPPPAPQEEYTGPSAGCTAVVALVRGGQLVVANAGDSRCVLSRRGRAGDLTHDHKPTDPEEYARILKAGGFVTEGRVNGSLTLSRALGDLEYKQARELPPEPQAVTALPEVRSEALGEGDEFLILACDGIWDVLTNQEVRRGRAGSWGLGLGEGEGRM